MQTSCGKNSAIVIAETSL